MGAGAGKVVCEEKHMGSRTIVIVGKNTDVIERVFGIVNEGIGVVYTRTGRAFFQEEAMEQAFLERIDQALHESGFYHKFQTDWVCLDTELMPWSAKAQHLLVTQYGSVGTAATHALQAAEARLRQAAARDIEMAPLLERYADRPGQVAGFVQAYRRYCWPVNDLEGYKLAPFHILATEGKTWLDQDHEWHMENIRDFCAADTGLLLATPYKVVHLDNEEEVKEATDWWVRLTAAGGEGMVVKPYSFIHTNKRGLAQPAIKIRGQEYLRIIYGPEYTRPENLNRLKSRGLSGKRSLALREFALGVEGLQRFVNREPLRRIHECVFAVLALESEPLDPRL
jgi:protein phosphatase